MNSGESLRGPQVQLRPAVLEDVPAVQELWSDPDVRKYLFDDRVLSPEEVAAYLKASSESFATHGYGIWLVRLPPSEVPVGFAGLLDSSGSPPNLVVGLAPEHWGRGLAREAACAMLNYVFHTLQLGEIHADADEANVASLRLLKRLRFQPVSRASPPGRPLMYFRLSSRAARHPTSECL